MLNIFRMDMYRFNKKYLIWLVGIFAVNTVSNILDYLIVDSAEGINGTPDFADMVAGSFTPFGGEILICISAFVGLMVGRELKIMFVKNYLGFLGSRTEYVFAKMLTSLVISALTAVLSMISTFIYSLIVFKKDMIVDVGDILKTVGYCYLICLAVTTLIIMLNVLSKNWFAGVLFVVIWTGIINLIGYVTDLIFNLGESDINIKDYTLYGNLVRSDGAFAVSMRGVLVALAYIAVCTAVSCMVMKKRDVA